jgi:hypothetical protein
MSKNGIILSVVAVLLAAAYVYFFTDWLHKDYIQIIPQIRPIRTARAAKKSPLDTQVYPVSFSLNPKCRLTSVKVVNADDYRTNKYASPLWHLISDSNSVPTPAIVYGQLIRGMKPAIPRARPETLQPDVIYTLLVDAVGITGRTNFHTREVVQPATQ